MIPWCSGGVVGVDADVAVSEVATPDGGLRLAGVERDVNQYFVADYMRGDEVLIHVTLNTGQAQSTVWSCDLTDGYVRINADYTT